MDQRRSRQHEGVRKEHRIGGADRRMTAGVRERESGCWRLR
uniref:Uncharacterized protein n=1 Tax=Lotus japonicus TaxID=34305 RepID=I3T9S4_LOTJA|nr:unknown [Lotus japonicus]